MLIYCSLLPSNLCLASPVAAPLHSLSAIELAYGGTETSTPTPPSPEQGCGTFSSFSGAGVCWPEGREASHSVTAQEREQEWRIFFMYIFFFLEIANVPDKVAESGAMRPSELFLCEQMCSPHQEPPRECLLTMSAVSRDD